MFNTPILMFPGKKLADLAQKATELETASGKLLSSMVYEFEVTSGAGGLVTLNYSSLGLTKAPRIITGNKIAVAGDTPLFIDEVGTTTKDQVILQVRRITSILATGLVPQYSGVLGIKIPVYVRPVP